MKITLFTVKKIIRVFSMYMTADIVDHTDRLFLVENPENKSRKIESSLDIQTTFPEGDDTDFE